MKIAKNPENLYKCFTGIKVFVFLILSLFACRDELFC